MAELEDALGLPELDEEPAADQDQETVETGQDTQVSEPETASGDVVGDTEGPDTGETEPGPQKAAELSDLLAKMEQLERANSGLYAEVRTERERRKQLLAEAQKRADEEAATKKRAEAEASIPSKDEDPAGYLEAQNKLLVSQVNERLERMEQTRQEEAKRDAYRQAEQVVTSDEARFAEQNPGYYDALNFARSERSRFLRATHPDKPDDWIQGMIQQQDRIFAFQTLQQGVSPAQRAYDYAVRMGFQPGNGNGTAPAHAGAAEPATAAKPRPQQTSLSAVSSKPGGRGRKLSAEDVANLNMDVAEDVALFDKVMGNQGLRIQLEEQGFVQL